MNFIKAYFLGLKTAILNFRVLITTYLINLLAGVVFMFFTMSLFGKFSNQSLAFGGLMQRFDATIIGEILNNYSYLFGSLTIMALSLGIFYWVMNVFITGGILATIKTDKFSMKDFFAASGYNFFSFLLVDILAVVIIGGVCYSLLEGFNLIQSRFQFGIETGSIYFKTGALAILCLSAMFIFAFMTYTKVMLVLNQSVNFGFYLLKSLAFIISRFYITLPLLLLLLVPPAFFVYGYFRFQSLFFTSSWGGFLVGFAIQQVFILIRIFFRIWLLSSHFELYDRMYHTPKIKVNNTTAA